MMNRQERELGTRGYNINEDQRKMDYHYAIDTITNLAFT